MDKMEKDTYTGKERFIFQEDTDILSVPQCADCIHNEGMMRCAALASKPMEYMLNVDGCPMKEVDE